MTGEETSEKTTESPYYIPPTAGPNAQPLKTPGKKTGNDWLAVVHFIIGTVVLIAAFQLYFILQDLIRTWLSDQFVPLGLAVYYIAIMVTGVWLIRDYIRNQ